MILNVLWCPNCQISTEIGGKEDKCPSCNKDTQSIGWIEVAESPNGVESKKS